VFGGTIHESGSLEIEVTRQANESSDTDDDRDELVLG
jgi:hypothetical protein